MSDAEEDKPALHAVQVRPSKKIKKYLKKTLEFHDLVECEAFLHRENSLCFVDLCISSKIPGKHHPYRNQ